MLHAMEESIKKLDDTVRSLQPWISQVRSFPCLSPSDLVGYRCRCSFQLLHREDTGWQYAIRHARKPVIVNDFPIANKRIQVAMQKLLVHLNEGATKHPLSHGLTSITFSSSWSQSPSSDCLVTLHYHMPVSDEKVWLEKALHVCETVGLTQLTGRSKKRTLRALDREANNIHDTICLRRAGETTWSVGVKDDTCNDAGGTSNLDEENNEFLIVRYEKPEGAFCHPNSKVMCRALEWLLSRVSQIAVTMGKNQGKPSLLELYCGCGAHSMPLARSGLLSQIIAVELDSRLVAACRQNATLNGLDRDDNSFQIILEDATLFALKREHEPTSAEQFHIVLVDPPKQGLGDIVCEFILNGICSSLLYISCGREALVRDLDRLCGSFVVVDCVLLDLFPQTGSVESLVHLQRRYGKP